MKNKVYIYDLRPGDISFRGNTMVICYGEMKHESYPMNLVARVTEEPELEALKEACRRAFREPGEKIVIKKKV